MDHPRITQRPIAGRPLRILIGTFETAGFIPDLADGLRALGQQVTTALAVGLAAFDELRYDVDIGDDTRTVSWPDVARHFASPERLVPTTLKLCKTPLERIVWLIEHHDVFLFVYTSLHHDDTKVGTRMGLGRDFPLLKRLGKTIIAYLVGPESRHVSAYDQQNVFLGNQSMKLGDIVPGWSEARHPLVRPLMNLRRCERYADLVYSQPNQAGLALRPYQHAFAPIDLSLYQSRIPARDIPVVVHAPSDKSVKGTALILEALDRLRAEGVPFDLRLLHGVSNREVREALSDADVAIDQLHLPLHGKLGVEAMASGCALVTCDRVDLEPFPPNRPIHSIGPENLVPALRQLLTDKARRVQLAREGREYACRHHDHRKVMRQILDNVNAESITRYDHYPTFFARHYQLSPGVTIPLPIQQLTRQVVRQWGLPEGVSADDLITRGLMAPPRFRWKRM